MSKQSCDVLLQSMRNNKPKGVRFEITLLTALCITQYYSIEILNILLTGCILWLMLSLKEIEDCTLVLIVALPMFNLLNLHVGTISLYYLLIFVFWLRYLQFYHWYIKSEKFFVLVCLLLIQLTAGDIISTMTWFVLLSVLVLTYNEEFFDKQIYGVTYYLSISFIIASFFGYLMLLGGRSIYMKGYVWSETGVTTRFAGIIGDAVFFSQCCALLVGANLAVGCYLKYYLFKSVVISILITGFCLLSYSKTGLSLIVCEVVAVVMWQIKSKLRKQSTIIYSLLIIFICICTIVFLIYYILTHTDNELIKNYLIRFSRVDLLTGRNEVWEHYILLLKKSWRTLICAMPKSDFTAFCELNNGNTVNKTHNIYIETVCAFGLIATLCILIWIFVKIVQSIKRRDGILCLMPICVILASGYSLHGHFEFHYYTLVAVAMLFLNFAGHEINMFNEE